MVSDAALPDFILGRYIHQSKKNHGIGLFCRESTAMPGRCRIKNAFNWRMICLARRQLGPRFSVNAFGRIIRSMRTSDLAAYGFSLVALIGSTMVFVDQLTGPISRPLTLGLLLGFGGAGASVYAVKRRPFGLAEGSDHVLHLWRFWRAEHSSSFQTPRVTDQLFVI